MKLLALCVSGVLGLIAIVHVYWGAGGLWPADSERKLIDTVIGNGRMEHMPSLGATLIVAALLVTAMIIALGAGGVFGSGEGWLVRILAGGCALVFLARGIGGFFFEKLAWTPVEPFASLNIFYYSPLCILLGVSFLVLARVWQFTT